MSHQWSRLFLAALLSAGGVFATYIWDKKNNPEYRKSDTRRGLAYIRKPIGNVKRKTIEDYTAFPIREGASLFEEDSVLTEANSDVIIEFPSATDSTKIASTLHLEADSKIVLKKESGAISLDLLEGTLDVKNTMALTLNTEAGKIDLSKVKNLQLSKAEDSNLRFKVNEGSIEIKGKDGKIQQIKSGESKEVSQDGKLVQREDFNFILPLPDIAYKTLKGKSRQLTFKWTPLKQTSELQLEGGPSRKQLKPINYKKISDREIQTQWAEGDYYWRLRAIDPTSKKTIAESTPQKLSIKTIDAPVLLEPSNQLVKIITQPETVQFSWALNREDYKAQIVQILTATNPPKVIQQINVPMTETTTKVAGIPAGVYTWLVKGTEKDTGETISSIPWQFALKQKEIIRVAVNWDLKSKDVQEYVGEPNITLGWSADKVEKVKQWRLKLTPEVVEGEAPAPIDLTTTAYQNKLEKPGRYLASVEALGEGNEVLGVSSQKQIEVKELPPPTAPIFRDLKAPNDILNAKPNGVAEINVNPINGAQKYKFKIVDAKENIKEYESPRNTIKIDDLTPGLYTVKTSAVDAYGREGQESISKIQVPDKNDLAAPVFKGVKVK